MKAFLSMLDPFARFAPLMLQNLDRNQLLGDVALSRTDAPRNSRGADAHDRLGRVQNRADAAFDSMLNDEAPRARSRGG